MKMQKSGAKAYLVTHRLERHRQAHLHQGYPRIIDAILDGSIKTAPTKTIPYFNFEVPTELPGVDPPPSSTRATPMPTRPSGTAKAKDLASRFQKNFVKYESNEAGKALVPAGPQL